ncbi:hypothetical protein BX265_6216 [Streptomyces sp. TLI_235]|nr:hypothetical protein [Streptomyces sp. TLI_235]PBC71605.1 hypothetical protein BX265_6216 [Streptomyces sp. TLI_235]
MGNPDMVVPAQVLNPEARALYLEIALGRVRTPGDSPELRELLHRGLIAPNPEAPGDFRALDAAAAALQTQEELLQEGIRQLATAAAVRSQWQPLADAYQAAHPTPSGDGAGLEVVTGKTEMQARMVPITASCAVELLTAQPGGPRPPGMLAMSYQRDLAVLDRGAKIRTIYQAGARRDPQTVRWVQTMTEQGAQVRTVTHPFPRTIIVDSRVAVIATEDPERAVIVRDPDLVRYVRLAWLRDWEHARPWDGGPEAAMTVSQAAILRRLAEGDDLEAIARAEGVSRRMISKRLESLREAVGARSTTALVYWWAQHERHVTPVG